MKHVSYKDKLRLKGPLCVKKICVKNDINNYIIR